MTRARDLLIVLASLVASLFVPALASASTGSYAETRVRGFDLGNPASARVARSVTLGTHQGYSLAYDDFASGSLLAARGARFVTNAAGETRIFLRGAEGTLEVSSHAAQRITQRGVSLDAVEDVISSQKPFQYFHDGVTKTGFYDPASQLFVGSVDNTITTVIPGATPNYINNLMGAVP